MDPETEFLRRRLEDVAESTKRIAPCYLHRRMSTLYANYNASMHDMLDSSCGESHKHIGTPLSQKQDVVGDLGLRRELKALRRGNLNGDATNTPTPCALLCTQQQINADLHSQLQSLQRQLEELRGNGQDSGSGTRPQFGGRRLDDPDNVYHQNAWDDVQLSEDDVSGALEKIAKQAQHGLDADAVAALRHSADRKWDAFYTQHHNKFFKDRHWLFTEFPELTTATVSPREAAVPGRIPTEAPGCSSKGVVTGYPLAEASKHATRRVLEVGCGAGNTVFPLLTATPVESGCRAVPSCRQLDNLHTNTNPTCYSAECSRRMPPDSIPSNNERSPVVSV
eukprot:m.852383 g.852383  ORF g.852383 m.852383 type:complete len:337 (+) comp23496_c0_seq4:232-1242(+)